MQVQRKKTAFFGVCGIERIAGRRVTRAEWTSVTAMQEGRAKKEAIFLFCFALMSYVTTTRAENNCTCFWHYFGLAYPDQISERASER